MQPLALIALAPFLGALRGARVRRGVLLGLVFGVAYYGAVMYWIGLFGELPWAALAIANACYLAVFGAIAPALWRPEHRWRSVAGWAGLWVALEFARGTWPFGGLTWGGLAYTQPGNRFLLPLATITGGWGIAFVVAFCGGTALLAWDSARGGNWGRGAVAVLVGAALVLAPVVIPFSEPDGPAVDVVMLQEDISDLATDLPAVADLEVAERFASAHLEVVRAGNKPDLIVWPENAFDQDPTLDPTLGALMTTAVETIGVPTLIGAITGPPDAIQYNETLLIEPDGSIAGRHAKTRLVPFGEFVPWRPILSRYISLISQVRRDLTPGSGVAPITYIDAEGAQRTVGSLICFESAFSEPVRRTVSDGAEFIVVSSNNASYQRSAASEQHIAMGRIRAVENGRWVAQAGLTGISAFIDPRGRILDETGLFETASLRHTIVTSSQQTLFTRYGDWFPWLCVLIALGVFLTPRSARQRRRGTGELPAIPRTLVVLPTYNERATIAEVLSRLLELPEPVDILVVDDGSPDGTAEVVQKAAEGGAPIRLLSRPTKSGLASAYAAGFGVALEDGYDLIVEMDSDLSHQPEELSGLLAGARTAHLTIGSRYVPGGSVTNWGRLRRLLSRAGNLYARISLGFDVQDATSGFRVYRRDLLAVLTADGVHHEGYGFQIELAHQAWQAGYVVSEVPITFREREHGHSKISRRIVVEALWLVAVWGLRDRFRPEPGPAHARSST